MISGVKAALAALLALFYAEPAAFTLPTLLASMREVKQADATFTERRDVQLLTVPILSSGRLSYTAPDRLVKEMLEPHHEVMTVTERDVTVAGDDAPPTVIPLDQAPELRALIDGLRATLAGDEKALTKSYEVRLGGDASSWTLDLAPRDGRVQKLLKSLHIEGQGTKLRKVDTVDANGDRSVMTIQ